MENYKGRKIQRKKATWEETITEILYNGGSYREVIAEVEEQEFKELT